MPTPNSRFYEAVPAIIKILLAALGVEEHNMSTPNDESIVHQYDPKYKGRLYINIH